MSLLSIFVIVLWSLAAAGVVWYLAAISTEVTYVTLADVRKTERSIPLLYRALLPFVGNFDSVVSRPVFSLQV